MNHHRFALLFFCFRAGADSDEEDVCSHVRADNKMEERGLAREPRQRQKGRGIQRASMPRTEVVKRPSERKTIKPLTASYPTFTLSQDLLLLSSPLFPSSHIHVLRNVGLPFHTNTITSNEYSFNKHAIPLP
jgi:hypothetical protein